MPKSNSLFVDTSGWACYVDRNDPQHPGTVTTVKQAVTQKQSLVTTNYVIAELASLLSARLHLSRERVISIIELMKSMTYLEIIHINEATDAAAWAMFKQYTDKEWSFVDVTSFVVMRQFGITEALATDHHFSQAGFIRLPAS